jgi:S1-C subfamily serine protease
VKGILITVFNFAIISFVLGEDDLNGSKVLNADNRLNGKSIQNAFGKAKDISLASTVRLLRNQKLIALGGIIHPSGYILTKASTCVGAREAETFDGKKYSLKIKKRYEESDLAIYQLISEKNSFPSLNWDLEKNATEGSWVIAAHSSLNEIRVGVKSGNSRKIEREGGVMGVLLVSDKSKVKGVKVSEVVPQAAAYRAGLLQDDIITHVDERRVKTQDSLIKIVGKKDPGDVVKITLVRKSEIKKFVVTLGHRSVTFDLFNRNLQMSGPVSKRKDNFSMILQHDLPLPREAMGGPLFNSYGQCIGINIARVDRVTMYALPANEILETIHSFIKQIP